MDTPNTVPNKKKITFWSDESEEAQKLRSKLEEHYVVESKFSGSPKPQVFSSSWISSGYSEIRLDFIVPMQKTEKVIS